VLLGLLAAVCYAIGTEISLRFGLDEKEHAVVREALRAWAKAAARSQSGGHG
jgi:hypothetical protein